jgi:hypothetical protein
MFCEFLHAFAIIWDVNNESDDERKLYKHAEKPIKRWFTESGALIKAEMLAKWLTYHKSTFQDVYHQLLLTENKKDRWDQWDEVYDIVESYSPVFTDEILIFGLCMHFNVAEGTVELKQKLAELIEDSAGILGHNRVVGINRGTAPRDSYIKPHRITLLKRKIKEHYSWTTEYFDNSFSYFWRIHYSKESGAFFPYYSSDDHMHHQCRSDEDDHSDEDWFDDHYDYVSCFLGLSA